MRVGLRLPGPAPGRLYACAPVNHMRRAVLQLAVHGASLFTNVKGSGENPMRTGRLPVYQPVDHHSNFSGYLDREATDDEARPWPVRRRLGVFIIIALVSWIVVLSPLLLIG